MSVPTASIVINNFNYARFLGHAIDSALAQTLPGCEVIVVDDGSSDASRQVVESYGARVRPIFKSNGGQGSAFNAGFAAARAAIVCFLDADDALLPRALESIVPRFAAAGVARVHWPLRVIDEAGRETGALMPSRALPQGDLHDLMIREGPDSYLGVPTSGNAWARHVLDRVLPVPEGEYRQGADGYLLTLTPLYGTIAALEEPQGCYRIHGANQYWRRSVDERISGSLERYDRRAASLAGRLRESGIAVDETAWRRSNEYHRWLTRMRRALDAVRDVVPAGARLVLIDNNEWGSPLFADRPSLPFLERDGVYWGAPADDQSAIDHLERLRRDGVRHVVVGWPAFWWLDHYVSFRQHLERAAVSSKRTEDAMVFELRP